MTVVRSYLLDTNVILRFLMQDDKPMGAAAKRLVEQARNGKIILEVPFIAISEAVHTLRTLYKITLPEVAREIGNFVSGFGVRLTAPAWILDALEDCQRRNVSFGDACIAAEARASELTVASFDTDFDRFPGVARFEPK